MVRWIRRLLILLLMGAGGAYVFRTLKQRRDAASDATLAPQWPPLVATEDAATPALQAEIVGLVEVVEVEVVENVADVEDVEAVDDAPEAGVDWVAPANGSCPDGYPIKANNNSRIFHVPGGRFYDRSVPERCYASADAAERDGYRRAKA